MCASPARAGTAGVGATRNPLDNKRPQVDYYHGYKKYFSYVANLRCEVGEQGGGCDGQEPLGSATDHRDGGVLCDRPAGRLWRRHHHDHERRGQHHGRRQLEHHDLRSGRGSARRGPGHRRDGQGGGPAKPGQVRLSAGGHRPGSAVRGLVPRDDVQPHVQGRRLRAVPGGDLGAHTRQVGVRLSSAQGREVHRRYRLQRAGVQVLLGDSTWRLPLRLRPAPRRPPLPVVRPPAARPRVALPVPRRTSGS